MTARPEDEPLSLEEGHAERVGRPPRDAADDGKSGGQSQGGRVRDGMTGEGGGTNTQRGGPAGSEDEREAPGMSTEKKADDTK